MYLYVAAHVVLVSIIGVSKIYIADRPTIIKVFAAQLISAFVFATWIVQSLVLLKSEISSFQPFSVTFSGQFVSDLVRTSDDQYSLVMGLTSHIFLFSGKETMF